MKQNNSDDPIFHRSRIRFTPRFFEYKVVWPNRGGGFGIAEIVDVVNLQSSEDARRYHEPRVLDTSIFFPMNWTFQLTCDRIRPDDCVFNPVIFGTINLHCFMLKMVCYAG